MKNRRIFLTSLVLGPGFLLTSPFFVATDGSDANPGTEAKSFATLERARDAVREFRSRNPESKAEMRVRGGVYELPKTHQFDAVDSGSEKQPVLWAAQENEKPIRSGGGRISEFVPHKGQILKADVKSQGF